MIVKQTEIDILPSDPLRRAGLQAERQMAFYLHRDFAIDPKFSILNDIRLVDPDQPEPDGRPGVCQIDHLVLHRWGAIIIESKSVTDEVAVRDDGGGDEWTRKFRGRVDGFASPIQQARRQGEFLRAFLQHHRESLLGKMPTGLRTLGKLVAGTDQRGFGGMPIQIIVAISDQGKITRVNEWREPTTPFQTFVSKADNVGSKIRDELGKYKAASGLLADSKSEYGSWAMKAEEVGIVAGFLHSHHQPRVAGSTKVSKPIPPVPEHPASAGHVPAAVQPAPRTAASGASCRGCKGTDLAANWGKYGYYWKCNACGVNTTMPTICSACGAEGRRGQVVKIRKEGPQYFRACEPCGIEEKVWTEA